MFLLEKLTYKVWSNTKGMISSLSVLFALLIIPSNSVFAQCSGSYFDPGGASSNYPNNSDVTNTLTTSLGQLITISFDSFNVENNYDFLTVYDGPDASSPEIAKLTGTSTPADIQSSSNTLTLRFTSDGSVNQFGYSLSVSCQKIAEICNNQVDDDFDGLIDEYDPDCAAECSFICDNTYTFSWFDGSSAGSVWEITNGESSVTRVYPISGPIGTYNVSVTMSNPDGQNIDFANCGTAGNHFYTATCNDPNAAQDCDNDPNTVDGQFTYDCDYLTFGITSDNSNQGVSITYDFEYPAQLCNFEIGDIDYQGSGAGALGSWQDEIDIIADSMGIPVAINAIVGAKVNVSNNNTASINLVSDYDNTSGGNLNQNDPNGHAFITTLGKVTSITFTYSNGPDDDGTSDDHAIRLDGFDFCPTPREICDNGVDDDGDGDVDCFDSNCEEQTISIIASAISDCTSYPNGDSATVDLLVSWPSESVPSGANIEVSSGLVNTIINVQGGATSPQTVQLTLPLNGALTTRANAKYTTINNCGKSVGFSLPLPCSNETVYLEAECASYGSDLTVVSDNAASGGSYLVYPAGPPTYNTVPGSTGQAQYTFGINDPGTYRVWFRISAANTDEDSWWVRMNGGTWVKFNNIAQSTGFLWDEVHDSDNSATPVDFNLDRGLNVLEVAYRENLAKLDKVFIGSIGVTPSGMGDDAIFDCSCEELSDLNFDVCDDFVFNYNLHDHFDIKDNAYNITYTITTSPTKGNVTLTNAGQLTYTSNNEVSGADLVTYERCYDYTSDFGLDNIAYNACGEGKIIDTYMQGIDGVANPTITIANPTDFNRIFVEIWAESLCSSVTIEGVNANPTSIYRSNGSEDTEKLYIAELTSISSDGVIDIVKTGGCNLASTAAYVERFSANGEGTSSIFAKNVDLWYRYVSSGDDCSTDAILIGDSDVTRDITFNIPLHEKDNSRAVDVTVEAGGITQTIRATANNAGPGATLVTITLTNIPAGTNFAEVTVCSPDGIGDSFGIGLVSASSPTCSVARPNYNCCESATVNFNITDFDATLTTTDTELCVGEMATMSVTSGSTNISYLWSTGEISSSITVTPVATTTYTVTVTDEDDKCEDILSETITVNNPPNVGTTNDGPACVGGDITLNASGSGIFTFEWTGPNGYTATGQNVTISNVTLANDGIYTVVATGNNGCAKVGTSEVDINPTPTVELGAPLSTCIDSPVTLTANGNGGTGSLNFTWSNGGSGSSITVTPSTTTKYYATVTDDNSCTNNDSVVVTVNNPPTLECEANINALGWNTLASCEVEVCQGDTLLLSVNPNGLANYEWSGPNGFTFNSTTSSDASISSNITSVEAGSYTVTITDNNGCTNTKAINVIVNAPPVANAGPNVSLCDGQQIILTASATGNGPYTYDWDNGLGSGQSKTVTAPSDPTQNVVTTYTVTVTDNNGCKDDDGVNINMLSNPTATVSSKDETCESGNGSITFDFPNHPNRTGIEFSINGGANYTQVNDNTGSYSFTGLEGNQSYNLSVRWGNTQCPVDLGTVFITEEKLPILQYTGAQEICDNNSTTISVNSTNTGVWTSSDETVAVITNSGFIQSVGPGQAVFTFTDDTTGCVSNLSDTLTVYPEFSITPDYMGSLCLDEDSRLTVQFNGGTGPYTYSWTGPNGFTSTDDTLDLETDGNYFVTVTGAGGCTANTSAFIYQEYEPFIFTLDSRVCEGESVQLAVNSSSAVSYQWDNNAGNATTPNVNVTPSVPGTTYNVTVTNDIGCETEASATIAVDPKPSITVIGPKEICAGDSTMIFPNSGGKWSSNNPAVATVNDQGRILGVSGGTATFYFENTTTGCTSDDSESITVNSLPILGYNGAREICVGEFTQVTSNSSGFWASSDNTVATVDGSGNVQALKSGSVTLTFSDAITGCSRALDLPLLVNPRPIVSLTGASVRCVGETGLVTASETGTWISSNPSVASINNSGAFIANASGTVTFIFTEDAYGCESEPISITIIDKPIITNGGSNTLCEGSTALLSANLTGTWTSLNPSVASIQNDGTVTALSEGIADIIFTSTGGCESDTLSLIIGGIPVVSLNGQDTLCIGSTVALSPSIGGTWTSNDPSIATITSSGLVNAVAPGTTSFYFTSDLGCISANTEDMLVDNVQTVSITGNNIICEDSTTLLTASAGGGVWSSSDLSIATIDATGLVTAVSSGNVTMIYDIPTNQCANTPSFPITVDAKPIISYTGSGVICAGESVVLTSNISNVTWTSSDESVAVISNSGVIVGISPGTVTFTATNNNTGCVSLESVQFTVNAPISLNIGFNGSICLTDTSALIANVSGGTAPYSYVWSGPDGFTGNTVSVPIDTNGNFSVLVTDNLGCTANTTAFVYQRFEPVLFALNTEICEGESINLSVNGGNIQTYQWGANAGNATTSNVTVFPSFPSSTYDVTVTNNNGCPASASAVISVLEKPIVSITGSATICQQETTQLSPSTGGSWTSSDNNVAVVNNSGLVTGIGQGTATFVYTNSITGCASDASLPVAVSDNITAVISGTNELCIGASANLSVNAPNGTWVSSNPTVLSIDASTGVMTANQLGTSTVSFTPSTGSCYTTASYTVNVVDNPTVSFTGPSTICEGNTTTLSPNVGGAWASSDVNVATVTNAGIVTGIASGTALFTFTSNVGCSSTTLTPVEVIGSPVVSISGEDTLCINETTNLLPSSGGIWISSDNSIASVNSSGLVIAKANGIAQFTFYENTNGCPSSDLIEVVVAGTSTPTFNGPQTLCVGDTTYINAVSNAIWESENPSIATISQSGEVVAASAGITRFRYTDSETGCTSAFSAQLIVNALPITDIFGQSQVCVGSTVQISPSSGGFWVSQDPSIATITNGGVVSGVSAGTTQFVFTNSATGCISNPTGPISILDKPVITLSGPDTVCVGETSLATTGQSGTWTSSNNSIALIDNSGNITALNPGSVTFTFTPSSGLCSSDASTIFTILPRPTVSITGASGICIGESTNLSPSTGGVWTSNNTAIATVTNDGVVTAVSSGSVTFTYTSNATGCISNPTSPVIIFNKPSTLLSGPSTLCIGSTTNLLPNTGGVWISNNPSIASITSSGLVTALADGEATFLFVESSSGCTSDTTTAITVEAKPNVVITGSNGICIGSTTTLGDLGAGTWVSSNPAIATANVNGVVTGISQGIVRFTFNASSGCVSNQSAPITVFGNPETLVLGDPKVCINNTINILPNSGGTWVSNNPSIASITNSGEVTGLVQGVASFTFTDTVTGCVSSPSDIITINSNPSVTLDGPSDICVGESTNVLPSVGGIWNSTNPSIITVDNNGLVIGANPGNAGLIFENTTTTCVSDTFYGIQVIDKPTTTFSGPQVICIGDTTYIEPSTGGTWTSSNTAVATISNSGEIISTGAGIARFAFTSGTGCVSDLSGPLTVNPIPQVNLSGPALLCIGETSSVIPGTGGIWTSSDPSIATISNSGLITAIGPGVASFSFVDNVTGCESIDAVSVTVASPPTLTNTGDSEVCIGYQTSFTSSVAGLWSTSDTRIATINNAGTLTGVAPGAVQIFFTDANTGCTFEVTGGDVVIGKCFNHDFNVTQANQPVSSSLQTNDKVIPFTIYGAPTAVTVPNGAAHSVGVSQNGDYTFTGDTPGKYVYNVPVCDVESGVVCINSVLEVTVLGNVFGENNIVNNLDFITTYASTDNSLPGMQILAQIMANDKCVNTLGCDLDSNQVVIDIASTHGIDNYLNGDIAYTPNAAHIGYDEMWYEVCDGNGANCKTTRLFVTTNAPSAPNSIVAPDDFNTTRSGTPVSGNVMLNNYDPEGDNMTVTAQGTAGSPIGIPGGSFYIESNGNYEFTPDSGFVGNTEFTYTVCDDNTSQACSNATVHLMVFGDMTVSARVYLEGALMFNGEHKASDGRHLMRDDLRLSPWTSVNEIPVTDPHNTFIGFVDLSAAFTHVGPGLLTENQTIPNPTSVFGVTGQDAIVDWVFLELRAKNDINNAIATRACLVQRDGDIVDLDGVNDVTFQGVSLDSFYLVVRHRSHLGVMSELISNTTLVDFTDPMTPVFNFGLDPDSGIDYTGLSTKDNVKSGVQALWAGDFDANGKVKYTSPGDDISFLFSDVVFYPSNADLKANYDFGYGYLQGDFDMNGKVKFVNPDDDKNLLFGQVLFYPLNINLLDNFDFLIEQIPGGN